MTFPSFAAGAEAVRAVVQDDLQPANCRLVDAREAALTLAGDGSAALLMLAFESAGAPLGERFTRARPLCEAHGGTVQERGSGGAGAWREAFLRAPYLRDTLVAMGVLTETFETPITWERLPAFVEWAAVKGAASEAILAAGGTVTHHHAVGRTHRPWYDRQRPEPFAAALAAAKAALDPHGILNPGVLLDGAAPGPLTPRPGAP